MKRQPIDQAGLTEKSVDPRFNRGSGLLIMVTKKFYILTEEISVSFILTTKSLSFQREGYIVNKTFYLFPCLFIIV